MKSYPFLRNQKQSLQKKSLVSHTQINYDDKSSPRFKIITSTEWNLWLRTNRIRRRPNPMSIEQFSAPNKISAASVDLCHVELLWAYKEVQPLFGTHVFCAVTFTVFVMVIDVFLLCESDIHFGDICIVCRLQYKGCIQRQHDIKDNMKRIKIRLNIWNIRDNRKVIKIRPNILILRTT